MTGTFEIVVDDGMMIRRVGAHARHDVDTDGRRGVPGTGTPHLGQHFGRAECLASCSLLKSGEGGEDLISTRHRHEYRRERLYPAREA